MFYTLNTFDKLFKELANENKTYTYTATSNSFEVEVLEDGKQKVRINTLGHNAKEIQVDVTEEKITMKYIEDNNTITSVFVMRFVCICMSYDFFDSLLTQCIGWSFFF